MSNRPPLRAAIADPSFTPAAKEGEAVLALLIDADEADEKVREHAERALARMGASGAALVQTHLAAVETQPEARAAMLRVLGRVAQRRDVGTETQASVLQSLLGGLDDVDPRGQRAAAQALGKLGESEPVETALLAKLGGAAPPLRRTLVEALGKVGGARALEALRAIDAGTEKDASQSKVLADALTKLLRVPAREGSVASVTPIDLRARLPRDTEVVFHCRGGLEALVEDELNQRFRGERTRIARVGAVMLVTDRPLAELQEVRTPLYFGFPLPAPEVEKSGESSAAVVSAMTHERTRALLAAITRGPVRYRLEWAAAGHQRGATYECAREIGRISPMLVNDPRGSDWEAVVAIGRGRTFVELWPRGLDDPRTRWRRGDVAGASHPTIAAALVRIAGIDGRDVVWDPFVGSGLELVERGLAGDVRALYGSDLDEKALEVAHRNLKSAGVRAQLFVGDARRARPELAPTVIITNPPFGKRVRIDDDVGELLDGFVAHAAALLPVGGSLVWISPRADRSVAKAEACGLTVDLRMPVDMGGFTAEAQRFLKKSSGDGRKA